MARTGVSPGRLSKVSAEIGVTGIQEIKDNIATVISRMNPTGREAQKVFMQAAMVCAREAKNLVPVQSGGLKDAIFAAYGDRRKPNVLVGVNWRKAPHAWLVEYGHGKVGSGGAHAHPYLRPAISATRSVMAAIIATGLREVATSGNAPVLPSSL